MIGRFNAYNLLAVYGVCRQLGISEEESLAAVSACRPVRGRMEILAQPSGRFGVVDFAHTPDALEKLLQTVRSVIPESAKMLVVCGCGGDRDASKRPVMGGIAARLADTAIFTADNPRSESIRQIIRDMESGVSPEFQSRVQVISDRAEAIQIAVRLAGRDDVVVVAGKGHESTQEIEGKKYPFDDRSVLEEALREARVSL